MHSSENSSTAVYIENDLIEHRLNLELRMNTPKKIEVPLIPHCYVKQGGFCRP